MMRVLDHEPQWWFLLEEGGSFFLDANCSHSFVSHHFLIELDADERNAYAREGRAFINRLATEIQHSAPAVTASVSRFMGRNLSGIYSDKVDEAIERWRSTVS